MSRFVEHVVARTRDTAVSDERGVTAVEYALVLAFIVIAIIVGATALGDAANTKYVNAAAPIAGH